MIRYPISAKERLFDFSSTQPFLVIDDPPNHDRVFLTKTNVNMYVYVQ